MGSLFVGKDPFDDPGKKGEGEEEGEGGGGTEVSREGMGGRMEVG